MSEMQQKSQFEVGSTQVVAKLSFGDVAHSRTGFDLHYDPLLDKEVEAMTANLYTSENDGYGNLPLDQQSGLSKSY